PQLRIGGAVEGRQDDRVLIPPLMDAPERPPSDLVWSFDGASMGTTWSVRLVPPPGAAQAAFPAAVEAELAQVVAVFSPWEADSEISRFNAAPAGPFALSADFWTLL